MPETENGIQGKQQDQERVLRAAFRLFAESPDWVTFFRKILGLKGVVRRTYTTSESLAEFKRSDAYAEILKMLTQLRERTRRAKAHQEPIRVITVRLPKSLHEALRAEAYERRTTMNKLCISKLLQFIDNGLIPKEKWQSAATDLAEQAE